LAVAAGCDKLGFGDNSPTAPGGTPSPGSTIVYDVIGASDAIGVGSSVVCVPFTECPDGTGYAPLAARQLRAQGFGVSIVNLGIPTAVISPGFQALAQQYGRFIAGNFIEREMPFVRTNATLVTIFGGGNEVTTISSALGAGAAGSDPVRYIDNQVAAFAGDYGTLIRGIRNRSDSARIVALNVPNFAALPIYAAADLSHRRAIQRASTGMAAAVNALQTEGIIVVDTMCDARSYVAGNYSADGFHPNDAGYAYMAAEIIRAATMTAYPAAQSNCGFMTAVPPL
jgi:lysophospholipase L1-like esterase